MVFVFVFLLVSTVSFRPVSSVSVSSTASAYSGSYGTVTTTSLSSFGNGGGYVANCNGDYNATYTDCCIETPSTCAYPNAQYGNTQCPGNPACECNPGYLLSTVNGICIKPEDCPGGKVCGRNESFTSCVGQCPDSYCPVNDQYRSGCPPSRPCPSGCRCLRNYLRKSVYENQCILASDCPPVICTRPNEEWSSCQIPCFSDYCNDRFKGKPQFCPATEAVCIPRCICKKGFWRNQFSICVASQKCPPISQ